jgi:hypothetical protein
VAKVPDEIVNRNRMRDTTPQLYQVTWYNRGGRDSYESVPTPTQDDLDAIEAIRSHRARKTNLTNESFAANIVVVLLNFKGTRKVFLHVNEAGGEHSEWRVYKAIKARYRTFGTPRSTVVAEHILSERQFCGAHCRHLVGQAFRSARKVFLVPETGSRGQRAPWLRHIWLKDKPTPNAGNRRPAPPTPDVAMTRRGTERPGTGEPATSRPARYADRPYADRPSVFRRTPRTVPLDPDTAAALARQYDKAKAFGAAGELLGTMLVDRQIENMHKAAMRQAELEFDSVPVINRIEQLREDGRWVLLQINVLQPKQPDWMGNQPPLYYNIAARSALPPGVTDARSAARFYQAWSDQWTGPAGLSAFMLERVRESRDPDVLTANQPRGGRGIPKGWELKTIDYEFLPPLDPYGTPTDLPWALTFPKREKQRLRGTVGTCTAD